MEILFLKVQIFVVKTPSWTPNFFLGHNTRNTHVIAKFIIKKNIQKITSYEMKLFMLVKCKVFVVKILKHFVCLTLKYILVTG